MKTQIMNIKRIIYTPEERFSKFLSDNGLTPASSIFVWIETTSENKIILGSESPKYDNLTLSLIEDEEYYEY